MLCHHEHKRRRWLLPLAIVGHVVDAVRYGRQSDELALGSKVAHAALTAPRSHFDTSMLSGLITLFDMLNGRATGKQMEVFMARTAATVVVPNALSQVDRIFDPRVAEHANVDLQIKDSATVDAYLNNLKAIELERLIMNLGDRHPEIAEILHEAANRRTRLRGHPS